MLYDFKANHSCVLFSQQQKGRLSTEFNILWGKYCTSIWHKWEAIYMDWHCMKHPEISPNKKC
jgi:hypothetical protein